MLSKVSDAVNASCNKNNEEAVKRMIEHAKTSGLVENLCICLATAGSSLSSGSSSLLPVTFEVCRALWSLINALEILYVKGNAYLFPLDAVRSIALHRLGIRDNEQASPIGKESTKVVDVVTRALLKSKFVQVSISYCISQHAEAAACAAIQVFFRSCSAFNYF